MPLSAKHFANLGDSQLLIDIKAKRWKDAACHLDQADQLDEFGNTPLHAALGFQAPEEFLLALIKVYPVACQIHGTDDWTPLHVAAMYGGCSAQVMETLILAHPPALDDGGQDGIKGKTPRHYVGRHTAEIQQLLMRSTDEWSVKNQSSKGR